MRFGIWCVLAAALAANSGAWAAQRYETHPIPPGRAIWFSP